MNPDDTRKAGQALGAFLKQAGKKVAFDTGTTLAVGALVSKLQPQVNQMVNPAIQQPLSQGINPEQQVAPGNYADVLDARQHANAMIERQRYLQRLSLIQAEKQPTQVVHRTEQDPAAVALNTYKLGISRQYV